MNISMSTLKKGLLIFWAFFYSWICLTNILDGLKELHWLPISWHYTSGNFAFILSVIQFHHFPKTIAPLLFFGDIVWQGLTAGFFWRAVILFNGEENIKGRAAVITAFALGIGLWATFIIAVEVFIAFTKISEGTFFYLLIANIISLQLFSLHTERKSSVLYASFGKADTRNSGENSLK